MCKENLNCLLTEKCTNEKKIRADAIVECIHRLDNAKTNCHEDYIDGIDFSIGVLNNILMPKGADK